VPGVAHPRAARASARALAGLCLDNARPGVICCATRTQAYDPHMNQAQPVEPLLRIDGITKHFGPVLALDEVSFEVRAGEVVGLLGDNGAGKSTLIKIISGSLEPSAGRIWFDGREVSFTSPAGAKAFGIETVYQDLSLCPNVDTVANFFMGRELHRNVLGFRFLREREMQVETERALADIGAHIPSVRTTVEHLSGGQRQAIELCRFVHWGGRLVLLDEPFAALGVAQTRRGLELIAEIKRRGVAIVVITHNVLHAFQVADRIVVLRHGRVIGERPVRSTSPEEIISLVTGELGDEPPAQEVAV
jgi:D-xylose transport system ATP-binding protein